MLSNVTSFRFSWVMSVVVASGDVNGAKGEKEAREVLEKAVFWRARVVVGCAEESKRSRCRSCHG